MRVIDTLQRALKQVPHELSCYQEDLLCRLMGALIQTRSVNLKKLAAALSGSAQIESHYRRLQRFFSSDLSPQVFTQLIVQRIVRPGKRVFLTIDRTHWKYGQSHQNLLCLGLLHRGVSIPIETCSLGKAGNSSTQERQRLLKKALAYTSACCRGPPSGISLGVMEERIVLIASIEERRAGESCTVPSSSCCRA